MRELAKKITDAYFEYDPYNGADREGVEESVYKELFNVERMREMLEELSAMVVECCQP